MVSDPQEVMVRKFHHSDLIQVLGLLDRAFPMVNGVSSDESKLVNALVNAPNFIPELCLVAEVDLKIVGFILFTPIVIQSDGEAFISLALAPVAVDPDFQGQGIGSELILEGHNAARKLGFSSVVLIGHEGYYPRFGYQKASSYNIGVPFPAPDENVMAVELCSGGLAGVSGMVEYPEEFAIL